MTRDACSQQVLEEKLVALNALFAEKLPRYIAEIRIAAERCIQEPLNLQYWAILHRLLHTLAGSAGSFGFIECGLQARDIEDDVKKLLAVDSEAALRRGATSLQLKLRQLMSAI